MVISSYVDPYDDLDGVPAEFLLSFLVAFGAFLVVFGILFYVISSWFMMRVFAKAGVEGGWRAWVPVYREMVFFKLGDLNPWLFLILWGATIVLAPVWIGGIIGIGLVVFSVMAAYRVGLKLQKGGAWAVLYYFLQLVWWGILAFDRSRWNTAVPAPGWAQNGLLGDRTGWQGIPAQSTTPAGYGQGGFRDPYTAPAYPSAPAADAYPQTQAYTPPASSEPAPGPDVPPAPPTAPVPPAPAPGAPEPDRGDEPPAPPSPPVPPETPSSPPRP